MYSRSPKNPTLQLLQKCSKSASTTPQRPIWNTFGTVGAWDFWENGCTNQMLGTNPPDTVRRVGLNPLRHRRGRRFRRRCRHLHHMPHGDAVHSSDPPLGGQAPTPASTGGWCDARTHVGPPPAACLSPSRGGMAAAAAATVTLKRGAAPDPAHATGLWSPWRVGVSSAGPIARCDCFSSFCSLALRAMVDAAGFPCSHATSYLPTAADGALSKRRTAQPHQSRRAAAPTKHAARHGVRPPLRPSLPPPPPAHQGAQ